MRAALRDSVSGLVAALVVFAGPATAAAFDNAVLRGPAEAIAKAKAAAQKADERAAKSDGQAAAVVAETPADAKPAAPPAEQATESAQADADTASDDSKDVASYDPAAHRDPFVPMLLKGVAAAKTPLENYQLGQLKLVGIIAQSAEGYRAMVEDSSGLGYIITTGTPIGSSGGVVRSIEPRRVVIEESARDFYGDAKPKEVVMELPQEDRSP